MKAFVDMDRVSEKLTRYRGAGVFGWPFAISYYAASILLGLAGGAAAAILEKRGLLKGQLRFSAIATPEAAA